MAVKTDIKELFDRYIRIEHEIKLLQQDKKELMVQFKDKVDAKAFRQALRAAKIIASVESSQRIDFDEALDVISSELCIEHLE